MIKQVKLKEITSYSKGKQINGDNLIENGAYDYLNGGINPSGKWNEFNTNANTVTISEGGNSSGYVNFMTSPFWCGAHCYYLYDLKTIPKYLYYALKSQEKRLMNLRTGAAMPNIKKSVLAEFTLQIDTDSHNQKQVIHILDNVTEIIQNKSNQLKEYDQLIKSRFVEMFMEKDYPRMKMNDVSRGKGEYGAGSASILFDNTRPRYVRITDINDDGTLNDDFVSSINHSDDNTYRLEYGDFMFARMGATVGKTYAYLEGNQIYAGYLIRYRLNTNLINSRYLFYYTKMKEYEEWVKSNQSGAAQPGINAKKYGFLEVPVAPIELQNQFATLVQQVDKLKFAVQKSLDETQTLFDSLMQKYFG